jgi:N-acetylglucosaminyl-diphospho-decaprenol L-rhamnosyltransferase
MTTTPPPANLDDSSTAAADMTMSIVSHGQGNKILPFLMDLRTASPRAREIIVTLNIPEDESFLEGFDDLPLTVLRNATPVGFGGNHNAAFAVSRGSVFCVLNPDIRAPRLQLQPVLDTLSMPRVGACAPLVMSPQGQREDSARRFPTLPRLLNRVVLGRRHADYVFVDQPVQVDWVAGMFIAFRREAFAEVQGFDERYFMYMEDADICERLRRAGWTTFVQPSVSITHDAQRASRKDPQHLRWHITSALRYFSGF